MRRVSAAAVGIQLVIGGMSRPPPLFIQPSWLEQPNYDLLSMHLLM